MQSSAGREKISLPANPTQTKFKVNPNWDGRYRDGKHKPKGKK